MMDQNPETSLTETVFYKNLMVLWKIFIILHFLTRHHGDYSGKYSSKSLQLILWLIGTIYHLGQEFRLAHSL